LEAAEVLEDNKQLLRHLRRHHLHRRQDRNLHHRLRHHHRQLDLNLHLRLHRPLPHLQLDL